MKAETRGIVIEEFVGLKTKMYSFSVNNNKHKKAKGVNKIVVATIKMYKDYKDVLLNKKGIRHSMNRIQS